jgi:hypothetical protein
LDAGGPEGITKQGFLMMREYRKYKWLSIERTGALKKKSLADFSCKALDRFRIGGREGIRTLDPRIANAVLSQLSYSPVPRLTSGYNLIYQPQEIKGKSLKKEPGEQ